MDPKILNEIPPWDWPENAGEKLVEYLENAKADESDRHLAVELSGNIVVMNEKIAAALLAIMESDHESGEMRGKAAISLGPTLEMAHLDGFDDPDEEPAISEQTVRKIQETLRRLYLDARVPKEARRKILEGSIRAFQPWHADAVRAAYLSGDEDWKLTAVFCMRYVPGFDEQIVEALDSKNDAILYEAVCAAGAMEVQAAWPHVARLVSSKHTEKTLLLAAIEAAGNIRPEEVSETLDHLLDSEDEEIVEAVEDAQAMALSDLEAEDEDDEEDEDYDDIDKEDQI